MVKLRVTTYPVSRRASKKAGDGERENAPFASAWLASVGDYLNRVVLWHLQFCEKILARLGYGVAAANVSAAIDALLDEAVARDEISDEELAREERGRLLVEMFEKGKALKLEEDNLSDEE